MKNFFIAHFRDIVDSLDKEIKQNDNYWPFQIATKMI